MRRKIQDGLEFWQGMHERRPLILRGARQVGKTYAVRKFGRDNFSNYIEINLELEPELRVAFSSLKPDEIILRLSVLLNKEIDPKNSLLFIDEIQEEPQALMALRYFYELMPDLAVVAAGSLVEFVLESDEFRMPVGRILSADLGPMSFREFLDAKGEDQLIKYLSSVTVEAGVEELFHEKMKSLLREFLYCGGMPAVVFAHVNGHSPQEVMMTQKSIVRSYTDDFGRYAKSSRYKFLQQVFETAPRMTAQLYKYSHVNPDSPAVNIREALEMLCKSRTVNKVCHSAGHGLPLAAQTNPKKFKITFLDVGLMQSSLGLGAEIYKANDFLNINSGTVTEQFVGQELQNLSPFGEDKRLFFWARNKKSSTAEVDFLYAYEGKVYPVEVKAGKTGRLRSLKIFLEEHPATMFGIRLSLHELSYIDGVLSVPLYMVAELPRLIEDTLREHFA